MTTQTQIPTHQATLELHEAWQEPQCCKAGPRTIIRWDRLRSLHELIEREGYPADHA